MFRAIILGVSVSLILVGLEGLAIESVIISPPEVFHGTDAPTSQVEVTSLASWLAIGLGTSLTLYNTFNRQLPNITSQKGASSTTTTRPTSSPSSNAANLQIADLDYDDGITQSDEDSDDEWEEAATDDDDIEFEEDEEEAEDYNNDNDDQDGSDDQDGYEFDLDAFNDEFDIDDLISE